MPMLAEQGAEWIFMCDEGNYNVRALAQLKEFWPIYRGPGFLAVL